jgi:hypothetical protein
MKKTKVCPEAVATLLSVITPRVGLQCHLEQRLKLHASRA